jgi:Domain of Unknown Function (DUF928)
LALICWFLLNLGSIRPKSILKTVMKFTKTTQLLIDLILAHRQWLFTSIPLASIVSSALWVCLVAVLPTIAANPPESKVVFNPPRGGAPENTRGGASRGSSACSTASQDNTKHLSLLIPQQSNVGLTVSEHPIFFAYIPPSTAPSILFSLKNDADELHYQTTIPVSAQGGVVAIELPKTTAPLALNARYQWGVSVLCSGKLRPDSPYAIGWVKRVASMTNFSSEPVSIEQAIRYGANGLWYDALTTLAALRQQHPKDTELVLAWSQLLQSVGLGAIAQEPLF